MVGKDSFAANIIHIDCGRWVAYRRPSSFDIWIVTNGR